MSSASHHYSLPNPHIHLGMQPGGPVPGMPPGQAGFMQAPVYTAEQLLWMQQTYAQYMAQYMH